MQDLSDTILPSCGCFGFVKDNQRGLFEELLTSLKDQISKQPTNSDWSLAQSSDYEKDLFLVRNRDCLAYDWRLHADLTKKYWLFDVFVTRELDIPRIYKPVVGIPKQKKTKKRTWKLFHAQEKDK